MKSSGPLLCLTSVVCVSARAYVILITQIFPRTTCTAQCCDLTHEGPRQKTQSSGTGIFGTSFLLPPKGTQKMGLGDCCWPGVLNNQGYWPADAASSFEGSIPGKSCFPGPKASWGLPASMQMLAAHTIWTLTLSQHPPSTSMPKPKYENLQFKGVLFWGFFLPQVCRHQ